MKILLASNNKGKIKELLALLSAEFTDATVLSLSDVGYFGEIVEDGKTFAENALIKAHTGARLGYITVADDSGLAVDALSGEPGVYSARYAGEPCDDAKNNEKLLQNMKNVLPEQRSAKFVSAVACSFPDGREDIVTFGECKGSILTLPRGNGGFGYDPLFWYAPFGKTFAEMSDAEKNSISHRAFAMQKLVQRLKEII